MAGGPRGSPGRPRCFCSRIAVVGVVLALLTVVSFTWVVTVLPDANADVRVRAWRRQWEHWRVQATQAAPHEAPAPLCMWSRVVGAACPPIEDQRFAALHVNTTGRVRGGVRGTGDDAPRPCAAYCVSQVQTVHTEFVRATLYCCRVVIGQRVVDACATAAGGEGGAQCAAGAPPLVAVEITASDAVSWLGVGSYAGVNATRARLETISPPLGASNATPAAPEQQQRSPFVVQVPPHTLSQSVSTEAGAASLVVRRLGPAARTCCAWARA